MNHGGFETLGLEGKERHRLGGIRRELLDELDVEAIRRRTTAELGAYADAAAEGSVEEGDVDGEGDAVLVLAGDPVVVEEGFSAELGDGLDPVAVEEVVEEDGVVSCEVEVADLPHPV